jgi:hypothetical protein
VRAPAGAQLLRLYPPRWRARYGVEMLALLELRPAGPRDRLDLARGALDAWLHPPEPSVVPALAALLGGASWFLAALVVAVQPVPPDWPGYVVDMLPIATLGTALLFAATIGCALRLGDGGGRLGRIALATTGVGYSAWLAALIGVMVGMDYGATTAIASTAAGIGTVLVGIALLRAGDWPLAGLVVAAPVALLAPAGWTWLGFGAAWSAIGLLALSGRSGVATSR